MKYFVLALVLLASFCVMPSRAGKRNATVKLFMHELESGSRTRGYLTKIIGGAFSATGEGGKHWSLVIQFEGDSMVYLCELHRDPNLQTKKGSGGIKWICERMTKEHVQAGKKGVSVYNVGTIQTIPEELYEKCRSIPYNGRDYHLLLRNCQHWVKDLIGKLGLSTTWFNIKSFLEKTTGPGFFYSLFESNRL